MPGNKNLGRFIIKKCGCCIYTKKFKNSDIRTPIKIIPSPSLLFAGLEFLPE